MLGGPVRVTAAGRTDAGVHALGQVVNFTVRSRIPADGLLRGLNAMLPDDVSVTAVEEAPLDFHARYSAIGKTYLYAFSTSPARNPLRDRYACHVGRPLDVGAMAQAADFLVGTHDFASFRASGSQVATTVRDVRVCEVLSRDDMVYLWIDGGGFLRHMVRNIAGTLHQVGTGRLDPTDVLDILRARDRSKAGPTAPPQGLFLVRVTY